MVGYESPKNRLVQGQTKSETFPESDFLWKSPIQTRSVFWQINQVTADYGDQACFETATKASVISDKKLQSHLFRYFIQARKLTVSDHNKNNAGHFACQVSQLY